MTGFVKEYYPQHWEVYNSYPYNVQRWDAIRYLILDKIGGMYVDFDYECLTPLDDLIEGKTCCFALEPQSHCEIFNRRVMFNNALMASTPGHPFMQKIVAQVLSAERLKFDPVPKDRCVFNTTGPWILIDLYEELPEREKEDVYLVPDKYVTPFSVRQARELLRNLLMDNENEELENCLEDAYAVHYFFNGWMGDEK